MSVLIAFATIFASPPIYFPLAEKYAPKTPLIVFRHHPHMDVTQERSKSRVKDAELIWQAFRNSNAEGPFGAEGGLGRNGMEYRIRAYDLAHWEKAIDGLLKAGKLQDYDHWGLDKHGFGLVRFW